MKLSPIYEEQLAKARQEGQRTLVKDLLISRFGVLDEQLGAIVEAVLVLPSKEFMPILLNLSREELLARFNRE